jgi:arginine utilization regulatory protein
MVRLEAWNWPGNVRELSNVLEGILNFRSKGQITVGDLPDYLLSAPIHSLRRQLEIYEREAILRAMEQSGGNISGAARRLQIPRQTLQRKLHKYDWHKTCNEKR